jgi:RNA-directed DNA polymerase
MGTPQGGTISPMLSNMVLDELADKVKNSVKHLYRRRPTQWSPQVNVIRFADDVLITSASKEVLKDIVMKVVAEFIGERGLELN